MATPDELGDRKDAFEDDLRQALTDCDPASTYDQIVRTEGIIAARP